MLNVSEKQCVDINKRLIHVLDELLGTGDWQVSLFLKAASKQIQSLREQAQQLLEELTRAEADKQRADQEKEGHIKVYVSVYQTEGSNLQRWHKTLQSLSEYSLSRPVYREEEHVSALIRSKKNAQREAYVSIFIKENDVITLPNGKVACDRLGNEILTLKAGAIKPENIIEFIHSEQHYKFLSEGLVLK